MLRSPLEVLAERKWATFGVVVTLAASLWLVAAMGAAALQLEAAADGWWERFVPVVYLEGTPDSPEIIELFDEIGDWPQVARVDIDGPEEAIARLEEHLGADEVREMGVEAAMMPTGLIVYPELWRPGEVEVIARLEALEVRDVVIGVDVPEAGALAWIGEGRKVVFGLALVVLLGFLGALIGFAVLLRTLHNRERRANHLLEVFGASPMVLRQPSLFRGIVLGGIAGATAGMLFLPWSLVLDGFVVDIVGVAALPAVESAIWAIALLGVGLLLGTIVGWGSGRPLRFESSSKMDGLLDWEREET